jgi:hypothetical protein
LRGKDANLWGSAAEGAVHRRVINPDGAASTAVTVADHVQLTINPLDISITAPLSVFSFD